MIIDLRLADIDFELWALDEHSTALEASIERLKKVDRQRTIKRLKAEGLYSDEAEVDIAMQEHDQRVDH